MQNIQSLCELSNPYDVSKESDALFVKAMRENLEWHRDQNRFFARLLESRSFVCTCEFFQSSRTDLDSKREGVGAFDVVWYDRTEVADVFR
jgi:hypothetical protein